MHTKYFVPRKWKNIESNIYLSPKHYTQSFIERSCDRSHVRSKQYQKLIKGHTTPDDYAKNSSSHKGCVHLKPLDDALPPFFESSSDVFSTATNASAGKAQKLHRNIAKTDTTKLFISIKVRQEEKPTILLITRTHLSNREIRPQEKATIISIPLFPESAYR